VEDPWEGASNECKLANSLISDLHSLGIFSIWYAKMEGMDEVGRSICKYPEYLGMEVKLFVQWFSYIDMLNYIFIRLREEEVDSLCWSRNPLNGQYNIKLGYLSLAEKSFGGTKR